MNALRLAPLTGCLGAEVQGLDLRSELSPLVAEDLRAALDKHLVLFLRDQPLTDAEHLRFAEVFGTPNVYPATRARGLDVALEWIEDTPDSPPKADLWHTDVAFMAEPPETGVISMLDAPAAGGDTLWVNLFAVYDSLSAPLQALVDTLDQDLHPGPDLRAKLELQFGPDVYPKVAAEFSGARHPLVRVQPATGKRALFMCGAYVRGIAGLHSDESDRLLAMLRGRLVDPNFQCRWRWRRHDVAVWDERYTNHRGLSDHYPAYRRIRRCTVGRAKPVGVQR